MQVAIVTVGDELLAGDVVNTNATWLAERLTERGVAVREIVTVPDEIDVIAKRIDDLADRTDAVIVTGGVGGTPDDVTMDAMALAFDAALDRHDDVYDDVLRTIGADDPDDADLDVEAWSALPAGCRPIPNEEGLSPGCVVENVYVFPGIPGEMKVMFKQVADEFAGDRHVRTITSTRSESDLVETLEAATETYDVAVGSYPDPDGGEKRIVIRGEDESAVRAAREWLAKRV